ncbi:ArdC family protein [Halobacteriovorax sp. ZH2_bin.1]
MTAKFCVFETITNQIIDQLDKNIVPWNKPWSSGHPVNAWSGKEYRGINTILLGLASYSSRGWLTRKQIVNLGGRIKKGERGHLVYWCETKLVPKKNNDENQNGESDTDGKFVKVFHNKYYKVWNLEQVEIDRTKLKKFNNLLQTENFRVISSSEIAEDLISQWADKPKILSREQRAFYNPSFDFINMPNKNSFNSTASYYSTLFHELAHSTGHSTRLSREGITDFTKFGDHKYSKEELVAEITSCFLMDACNLLSVNEFNQSVSYINSWRKALSNDKYLIVSAASMAQKAFDLITNNEIYTNKEDCKTKKVA